MRAAAGLAAIAAGALLFDAGAGVVLAAAAALLAAFFVDAGRTPHPASLDVRRDVPETCGLGSDLARELVVAPAERAAGLALEVREEFPDACEVSERTVDGAPAPPRAGDPTGGPDTLALPAGAPARVARRYRCLRRGAFRLGAVRLRLRGPWGLVERESRLEGAQVFEVEPALSGLRRALALAASERWRDLGVRRVRRRGGRTEFESLRDYVRGDDPRHVDWKATARRGKPTVRQFQEERGQELVLCVDCGRRMRATSDTGERRGWTKLDWALDAALELAAVALARGDRVGCLAFDDRVRAFESPARGARQLPRLRRALFALEPSARETDYARALRTLAARHRRRALVLVVSDVADPFSVAAQRRALSTAARRHRLVFAALDDPAVRRVADGDAAPAEAPVGSPTPAAALRAVAMELDDDRRLALRELAGAGLRVVSALPAEAAAPLLAAWLEARREG